MTITIDLTTQIGQVRLEIGDDDDTDGHGKRPDGRNLSDQAINLWLTRAGLFQSGDSQVLLAAAYACEQLARDWATVSNITAPSRSESAGDVAAKWAERARALRHAVAGGGGGLRVRSLRATPATSEYTA